ncbi:MAG: biotin--[acetyl-CoA-carboxylase] ligase [Pseudomonadota bacterium]
MAAAHSEINRINPHQLKALLSPVQGRFDVDVLAECTSTNSVLSARAAQGAPSGLVVVADRQTAGRGRRGRSWVSHLHEAEASLSFSLLWRCAGGVERISGLSLAIGVAVARALDALGAQKIGLKWPNDILFDGRKLGGILVELQSEQNATQAIIGIGLNLQLPPTEQLEHPVAALAHSCTLLPSRQQVLAQLLIELAGVLDQFAEHGFAALRSEWQQRHVWHQQSVHLLRDGQIEQAGLCQGVDTDGALLILNEQGLVRCLSGDLSLRVA